MKSGWINVVMLLLWCGPNAFSQELSEFFDEKMLEEYHINWYTNKNGLQQDIVNSIYLDPDNFLWLLTPSGLFRFDGNSFKIYAHDHGHQKRVLSLGQNFEDSTSFYINYPRGQYREVGRQSNSYDSQPSLSM